MKRSRLFAKSKFGMSLVSIPQLRDELDEGSPRKWDHLEDSNAQAGLQAHLLPSIVAELPFAHCVLCYWLETGFRIHLNPCQLSFDAWIMRTWNQGEQRDVR